MIDSTMKFGRVYLIVHHMLRNGLCASSLSETDTEEGGSR